jgi:purine-binding chemotaxis protein CheW
MTEPYIIFELGNAVYGVRSQDVQHVDLLEHLTPVPNTAPAVAGVVFSRGNVVPALDLRRRFGLPPAAPTPQTRLIFIKAEQRLVALIVDAAREFRLVPADAIRPVEETLHGIRGNYVKGVAHVRDRLVLLLDVVAVLDPDEVIAASDAVNAAPPPTAS